jgi:hypothetical protein
MRRIGEADIGYRLANAQPDNLLTTAILSVERFAVQLQARRRAGPRFYAKSLRRDCQCCNALFDGVAPRKYLVQANLIKIELHRQPPSFASDAGEHNADSTEEV